MRKIGLTLSIIMLISLFSVNTFAADNAVIEDNFTDYTAATVFNDSVKQNQNQWYEANGYAKVANIGEDKGQVLDFEIPSSYDQARSAVQRSLTENFVESEAENHVVKLEMDIRPLIDGGISNNDAIIVWMNLGSAWYSYTGAYAVHFKNGKIWIGEWGNGSNGNSGSFVPGNWYHISTQFDIKTRDIYTVVSDEYGETVASRRTNVINITNESHTKFVGVGMTMEKGKHTQIDNVVVTTQKDIVESNVLLIEKFEKPSVSEILTNWTVNTKNDIALTCSQPEIGGKYGKAFALTQTDPNINGYWMKRNYSGITSGVVKYEFDVNPAPGMTILMNTLSDKGKMLYALFLDGGGTAYVGSTGGEANKLGIYKPGKWYHCVMEYDLDNKVMNIKMTDEDGNSIVKTWVEYKDSNGDAVAGLGGVMPQVWGAWNVTTMYDNIVVTKEEAQSISDESSQKIPSLSETDVKFYAGDIQSIDKNAVEADTDKLTLDFGVLMSINSLKSAVSLYDETAKETVAFELEKQDKADVYDMHIPQLLTGGHTYTLSVSTDAMNLGSIQMSKDFAFQFKTKVGVTKLSLSNIASNGNPVTKLNNLTEGNILNADVVYENTTGQEKKIRVLFCYYDGAEMRDIEFKTITVSSTEKIGTKPITHTIKDLTNIDKVSVIAWDDFANLISMPGCVEFK